MKTLKSRNSKAPTQRQLRVGEEVRHMLSDIFIKGEVFLNAAHGVPVTVSEMRVSPDLKNATAYVMPLGGSEVGGQDVEAILIDLNENAAQFSYLLAKRSTSKNSPRVRFKLDKSFDEAHAINALLKSIHNSNATV